MSPKLLLLILCCCCLGCEADARERDARLLGPSPAREQRYGDL